MISADLIVKGASAVLTCAGERTSESRLGALPNGAVAAHRGKIVWVGSSDDLDREVLALPSGTVVDAHGGIVAPGYVDAHTHVIFAGDRAEEFSRRCAGATYQEILAAGGGILATVRATRQASEEELVEGALPRLRRLLAEGVTTAEVKSGYALTVEGELKMLRALRRLGERQAISLVGTALPLHALPPEAKDREAWIEEMIEGILPVAAREGLARFCDVFVEKGAFTADEARRLAARAKELGLRIRLHIDQLSDASGGLLAEELGAATADHLEEITEEGIAALARAQVAATLLPTSTLYLKCPRYAPGRKLADAGVPLALGSNCNPGSAMSESFSLALTLACLGNGLSAAEAFYAATAGGARALGLSDRGRIEPGLRADLVIHGAHSVEHLAYHMATRHVRAVIVDGVLVHRDDSIPAVCV